MPFLVMLMRDWTLPCVELSLPLSDEYLSPSPVLLSIAVLGTYLNVPGATVGNRVHIGGKHTATGIAEPPANGGLELPSGPLRSLGSTWDSCGPFAFISAANSLPRFAAPRPAAAS